VEPIRSAEVAKFSSDVPLLILSLIVVCGVTRPSDFGASRSLLRLGLHLTAAARWRIGLKWRDDRRSEQSSDHGVQPTRKRQADSAAGGIPALDQAAFQEFRARLTRLRFGPGRLLSADCLGERCSAPVSIRRFTYDRTAPARHVPGCARSLLPRSVFFIRDLHLGCPSGPPGAAALTTALR
jgi:hypothetical protein